MDLTSVAGWSLWYVTIAYSASSLQLIYPVLFTIITFFFAVTKTA